MIRLALFGMARLPLFDNSCRLIVIGYCLFVVAFFGFFIFLIEIFFVIYLIKKNIQVQLNSIVNNLLKPTNNNQQSITNNQQLKPTFL
jgi:large-conductance mechanosensitive channel